MHLFATHFRRGVQLKKFQRRCDDLFFVGVVELE
jgi:hypothetical protein